MWQTATAGRLSDTLFILSSDSLSDGESPAYAMRLSIHSSAVCKKGGVRVRFGPFGGWVVGCGGEVVGSHTHSCAETLMHGNDTQVHTQKAQAHVLRVLPRLQQLPDVGRQVLDDLVAGGVTRMGDPTGRG
jgi:hypothetical protein